MPLDPAAGPKDGPVDQGKNALDGVGRAIDELDFGVVTVELTAESPRSPSRGMIVGGGLTSVTLVYRLATTVWDVPDPVVPTIVRESATWFVGVYFALLVLTEFVQLALATRRRTGGRRRTRAALALVRAAAAGGSVAALGQSVGAPSAFCLGIVSWGIARLLIQDWVSRNGLEDSDLAASIPRAVAGRMFSAAGGLFRWRRAELRQLGCELATVHPERTGSRSARLRAAGFALVAVVIFTALSPPPTSVESREVKATATKAKEEVRRPLSKETFCGRGNDAAAVAAQSALTYGGGPLADADEEVLARITKKVVAASRRVGDEVCFEAPVVPLRGDYVAMNARAGSPVNAIIGLLIGRPEAARAEEVIPIMADHAAAFQLVGEIDAVLTRVALVAGHRLRTSLVFQLGSGDESTCILSIGGQGMIDSARCSAALSAAASAGAVVIGRRVSDGGVLEATLATLGSRRHTSVAEVGTQPEDLGTPGVETLIDAYVESAGVYATAERFYVQP